MGSIRARSFTEYLQMIWRRRLVLLVVTSAVLIAAMIVINRLPDIYEAHASVVVTGKHDDRQAIADRVAAVRERLTSRQFLESVVQRHTLPAGTTRSGVIETAVGRMRKDIKVETQMRGEFPEMLSIKYKNNDPQTAKNVTDDLVSIFGNMNEAVEKQMADESTALDAELNQIESRLDQLSLKRASRGGGGGRPRVDFNALRAERTAAASSIDTLTDKQFALEREITEQKRQIAEQQKIVKSAPSEARSNSSYGVLLVRKAELEAQLKDYATQYTDKNPKVTQAQTQLAEINRQIAQLSAGEQGGPANSSEARELRTLQRELARMETELEVTQRELNRKKQALAASPAAGALSAGAPVTASISAESSDPGLITGSEYDRLKDRYEAILKRQQSIQYARTTSAGLDPGLFQIVEMPVVPQAPVGPDRLKLTLIAFVLALVLGLAVAIAFEIPGLFSIRDDRDVEYYLGAPVIVLIPETLTPSEQGRTRRLLLTRAIGLLLLAAILVPALVLLLNNLRVFHVLAGR